MNRYQRAYLLLMELDPGQLLDYAIYKSQLKTGRLQKLTPVNQPVEPLIEVDFSELYLFDLDNISQDKIPQNVLAEANEVVTGVYHPFGGAAAPLSFDLAEQNPRHWSEYNDTYENQDIKTFWEPARFTWAFPLFQAYLTTRDEKFSRSFWENFDHFIFANPVNAGPNWASGQEVALRLIPWLAAAQVFCNSLEFTPARRLQLTKSIWQHTNRIPPTLAYARSQNNNHYLSEALGLMIGGYIFRHTEKGKAWLQTGFHAFEEGIITQIAKDGTYSQHSNNYHRMMLHLSLIFFRLCRLNDLSPSLTVYNRLALATKWLLAQFDSESGHVPNLGHNDGSNLLPLGGHDYADYCPTLQAASQAYLGKRLLPEGNWDSLSQFLGIEPAKLQSQIKISAPPSIRKIGNNTTWGTLRCVHFHSRPAHADLLHVDLWWQGENIALDPGTYAYNLQEPWQNSLAKTHVHNTITVANQDQMIQAGKFLWLQRAEAHAFPPQTNEETAILYCNLPVAYTQYRTLKYLAGSGFQVHDAVELAKPSKTPVPVTIQWLLPDWTWELQTDLLVLKKNCCQIRLKISALDPKNKKVLPISSLAILRAGETLFGSESDPIRGWYSPTYLVKSPALSISVTYETKNMIEINSLWSLTKIE